MRRLSFLLLALCLLPSFAPSSAAKNHAQKDCQALASFRAADNRTVGSISAAFGVSVKSILATNNRSRLSVLEGGEVVVPITCSTFQGDRAAVFSYTTKDNETSLDEIAVDIFGGLANATDLAALNRVNGTNATEIFLGEGQNVLVPIPCTCSFRTIPDPDVLFLTYRVSEGKCLEAWVQDGDLLARGVLSHERPGGGGAS